MTLDLAGRYWLRLIAWTVGIYALLVLVSLTSPSGVPERAINMIGWGGLALLVAAFPAGVAVSDRVLRDGLNWRRLVGFALVAASGSLMLFVLGGWVGPALVRAWVGPDVDGEPAAMALGELRGALIAAMNQARAVGATATRGDWLPANRLAWHYFSRTDGSVLPFLFSWFGLFVGYWIRLVPRKELRQAQLWAIGVLIVLTTYFAGENSYEMIVLQAAGPAEFATDIRLIVPMVLVAVLGWPTVLSLWSRSAPT